MIPKALLHIAPCLALLGAVAGCDQAAPIAPSGSTAAFAGTWVGVKRLLSCSPAGTLCESQSVGQDTYFAATLNDDGQAIGGSVVLSEPSPLALPYGFSIKGQVSPSAQLSFERVFFQDVGEPPYSGEVSIKASLTRRLGGRLTKQPSASDSLTLVWEVEAVHR